MMGSPMAGDRDIWTDVEVSVFKPEGYAVRYLINTWNRGAAILRAMDEHERLFPGELIYANAIVATAGGPPHDECRTRKIVLQMGGG
jgi:hypothetical protein